MAKLIFRVIPHVKALMILACLASAHSGAEGIPPGPRFAFTSTHPDALAVVNKYFRHGDLVNIWSINKLPELGDRIGKGNQHILTSSLSELTEWANRPCDDPGGAGIIVYDPEEWAATPAAEKSDVSGSLAQGARLVNASGCRTYGIAPSRGFMSTHYQDCEATPGELNRQINWKGISLLVIQAQGLLVAPCVNKHGFENYEKFVSAVADIAKAGNPNILVFAEVSFNRSRPWIIIQAINRTRHKVDGFYLAYPRECKFCTPENLEEVLTRYRKPQPINAD